MSAEGWGPDPLESSLAQRFSLTWYLKHKRVMIGNESVFADADNAYTASDLKQRHDNHLWRGVASVHALGVADWAICDLESERWRRPVLVANTSQSLAVRGLIYTAIEALVTSLDCVAGQAAILRPVDRVDNDPKQDFCTLLRTRLADLSEYVWPASPPDRAQARDAIKQLHEYRHLFAHRRPIMLAIDETGVRLLSPEKHENAVRSMKLVGHRPNSAGLREADLVPTFASVGEQLRHYHSACVQTAEGLWKWMYHETEARASLAKSPAHSERSLLGSDAALRRRPAVDPRTPEDLSGQLVSLRAYDPEHADKGPDKPGSFCRSAPDEVVAGLLHIPPEDRCGSSDSDKGADGDSSP